MIEWIPQSKFIFFKNDENDGINHTHIRKKESTSNEKVETSIYSNARYYWKKDEKPAGENDKMKFPLPLFSTKIQDFSTVLNGLLTSYSIKMVCSMSSDIISVSSL